MQKIKIALVIRGFHNGGIEKVFESYFSHMDLSPYEIHIITNMKNNPEIQKKFENMGCIIHALSAMKGHRFSWKNIQEYNDLFKNNKFDVVHNNVPDNLFPLYFAKKYNVPTRILHAHNIYTAGYEKKNPFVAKLFKLGFSMNTSAANVLVGVSRDAAWSAFGEKKLAKTVFLPNAIETNNFSFCAETRDKMRRELGVENSFVIGHIGRYETDQKNQEFVLNTFCAFLKVRPDSYLLMLGSGERLDEFKKMSADLGIADRVTFTGNVSNVADYLQAMDVFVLPSRKEGLGIVAVEAQASGLFCLVSDRVPQEAKVSSNISFLSIDDGVSLWVEALQSVSVVDRGNAVKQVKASGYDIQDNAAILGGLYRSVPE